MNRFPAILGLAFLSITVYAAEESKLEVAAPPLIVIASDTPAATGTIVLRNSGKADTTAKLTIGPFFADPGGEPLQIVAKPAEKPIKAGTTELIPVELSNVTEPGRAKAEIRNGATSLGELHVLKRVFAFNVAPLGFDGKQPFPIHQIRGQRTSVTLLNPDPVTHSFVWSLREGSRELARGRVPLLRPNATVDIDIPREPGGGLLGWLEGTLQAPQAPGTLLLRAVPRGPAGIGEYWVSKDIPVQLQRTAGEGARRDFPQMGLILIFLFLGGITSLYLTYWVPNMLKKNDVRGEIEDLTQKIHQLRLTPSTLRVLLSVRRNQLRALLDSRAVTSLDFPPLAAECLQQVKMLERLIDLTQRIEFLLIDIEREWESGAMRLGPTILQRNRRLLQKSVERLEQGQLTEEELRAVETAVDQAKQSLGAATEDPKLTQEVFTRAQNLQKRKTALKLDELVESAVVMAPALEVTKIEDIAWPVGFWKLDYAVTKMEVAASVPVSEQPKLVKLLRTHSLEAYLEAVRLARQLREDPGVPGQLEQAFKDKKVRLSFHPIRPAQNSLVTFELDVTDPALNASAAIQTISCHWSFGDGYHADGWRVSHYFARPGKFSVTPVLTDRDNQQFPIDPVTVTVEKAGGDLFGARTRIEWIRLLVALFVVLLGLLAGAKEQLAKLDFVAGLVALFALGVGADQIKNLLAPRTDK